MDESQTENTAFITETTETKKRKNQYKRIANMIPPQTDIIDLILTLFARNELCTDTIFYQSLKDIEAGQMQP